MKPVIQYRVAPLATSTTAAFLICLLASTTAHASGLQSGTTAVTTFQTWLYSIVGSLAVCYLLWVGVQCWSNKADWIHDFGGGIAKVGVVGAVIVLAPWAWSIFTS
jgi:type IV secretory pathway VirB2 component (pilin)